MPTIQNYSVLEITPERFIEACSPSERFEIRMIISSPRFDDPCETDYTEKVDEKQASHFPKQLPHKLGCSAYDKICETFKNHAPEALALITEMLERHSILLGDILPLMRSCQQLERLRLKSLVNNPQGK